FEPVVLPLVCAGCAAIREVPARGVVLGDVGGIAQVPDGNGAAGIGERDEGPEGGSIRASGGEEATENTEDTEELFHWSPFLYVTSLNCCWARLIRNSAAAGAVEELLFLRVPDAGQQRLELLGGQTVPVMAIVVFFT